MRKKIENAILETLVVENKQSIRYAVDKIIDILAVSKISDYNKSVEQKVKDFLYEQAPPEVLRAVEHTVENPLPKVDHPTYNIYDWKIEMTLIPGMVAPKPSAPTSDSIHWLNTTDVRDNYVPGNPAPKK